MAASKTGSSQAKGETKKAASSQSKTASKKLIKMKRGDISADVHPDEVENYRKGGYTEA